jgi:hypothetical protein
MEWMDPAQAGECLLAGWVVMMVAIGLAAIGSEIWRRWRNASREVRRVEEER